MMSRKASWRHLTALTLALLLVLAACAGGTGDPDSGATTVAGGGDGDGGTTVPGSDGEPGADVQRIVMATRPPPVESNNISRDVGGPEEYPLKPLYENLIGVDAETGAWVPWLAESWELEPNGSSIRFFLREGVQFHNDMGEFTAQDVVFAFENLVDPPGAVQANASVMDEIVNDIEIVNDHELIFHNNDASYSFFELISYGAGAMAIMSKADFDARGGEWPPITEAPLAGTGPFQFVDRQPGEWLLFERVPWDHWRKNAGFDELELRYIDEHSSRLAALVAGEVHLTDLPGDLQEEAINQGFEQIDAAVAGLGSHLNFLGSYLEDACENPDNEVFIYPDSPMNDIQVRIAINKAIDREALNQAFFGGNLQPLIHEYWRPELPGYNPAWEERYEDLYAYDPEASRQILADAGYEEGEIFVQMIANDHGGPEGPDVIEAVANMLTDVGITNELVAIDPTAHREKRQNLEYESAIEYDTSGAEPITSFIAQGVGCRETGRGRGPENVEISQLYYEVTRELDPDIQAELWGELGDIVFEFVNHVPLGRQAQSFVANTEVVGEYTFPGFNMTSPYGHFEYIEPAG
jgi:peptide/nickel transport system substrate-binding protein